MSGGDVPVLREDGDDRIRALEAELARLRKLLDSRGVPAIRRHQVRNTLGLMRSILRRSSETSAALQEFAAHLEGRLDALLRVQTLLVASGNEGADLRTVVTNELLAHVIHEGGRASIEGPTVRLPPQMAKLLGLAFHELVTNALKFGAMSAPAGRIAVLWSVEDGDPPTLRLQWSESGLAILSPVPTFRGFGVEVLEGMLRYQLGAESTLLFRPEGLDCKIRLPLESRDTA